MAKIKRGMASTPTRLVAREIDQEDDDEQGNEYASGSCDDEEALFMPEVVGRPPNGGAGSFDNQLDQLEVGSLLPFFLRLKKQRRMKCNF